MDALFEQYAPTWRPDVLGGLRAWLGPTDDAEVMYFTSAEEAHANEQLPPPPELAGRAAEIEALFRDVRDFDIEDPAFG